MLYHVAGMNRDQVTQHCGAVLPKYGKALPKTPQLQVWQWVRGKGWCWDYG